MTVPGGAGSSVKLGPVITAPRIVTLDADRTVGRLAFDGSFSYTLASPGGLLLDNAGAGAAIEVARGTHNIAAPLMLLEEATLTIAPGSSLKVARISGAGLNLIGGVLEIVPDGTDSAASVIESLTIADGAALDLADSSLVLRSGDIAVIMAWVGFGRAGGDWNGLGIRSSAAASFPGGLTGLAAAANDFGLTDFAGQPLGVGDILLKYTWNGDADMSGQVDADDYFQIDSGFASAGGLTGWRFGDFDYSGAVDADDYFLIDSAFAGQTSILGGLVVPEPAGTALLAAAACGLTRRRRGKNRLNRDVV
jgi:hypothetical protein